jgi:chromate transporter
MMVKSDLSSVWMQAKQVFWVFLKLGLTSFGGPIAHIGYFQKTFVEQKKWLNESEFTQLLALCQFLPGPASSQLGFAIGYGRGGIISALSAFIGFTLPSVLLLIAFALFLPTLDASLEHDIIHGLKLVALVVVADAVINMSGKLCRTRITQSIALGSAGLVLLFHGAWAQILVVVVAGLLGAMWVKEGETRKLANTSGFVFKRSSIVSFIVFLLLLICASLPFFESDPMLLMQLLYRSGAMVFGGGHVVLPLLHDGVVQGALMTDDVFLAGYGASQAIPGPMFSFAAYLGVLISGEPFSMGWAILAVIAVFAPGFLLVTAALPYWQRIAQHKHGHNALAGVSAAVVGLLGAALYNPIFNSAVNQSSDLVVALIGFGMLHIYKLSPLWVVLGCLIASVVKAQIFY